MQELKILSEEEKLNLDIPRISKEVLGAIFQKKVYLESYGCQMNFADSEVVTSILIDHGYGTTSNINEADAIFLNTCAIRDNAELKIRNRLKGFTDLKKKNPALTIGILGCMAERLKTKLIEEEKIVDLVAGPDSYRDIPNLLSKLEFEEKAINVFLSKEETYGDISYNGHAKKGKEFENQMTNFGILMEIKGIEDPFAWSRDVVSKLQVDGKGLYYSPNKTRTPGLTSEGTTVTSHQIDSLAPLALAYGEYLAYIVNFIDNMNTIFEFGDDWGMYIPEVKYLSPEPLVNYTYLSLNEFPNVHFAGDALSARGITVSGAHGIYIAESLIKEKALEYLAQQSQELNLGY